MNRYVISSLCALLILSTGCSKEDDLDAGTVAEVVTHALGAADILATHASLVSLAPDQSSSGEVEEDIAILQEHLDRISEGDATVERFKDGLNDLAVIRMNGFASHGRECTGAILVNSNALCAAKESSFKSGDWCLSAGFEEGADSTFERLNCGGQFPSGTIVVKRQVDSAIDFVGTDGVYADIVSGFLGLTSFGDSTRVDQHVLNSEFRFVDSGMGLWKGEAIGLALRPFSDKARGGTMILQAPNGQIYATGWEPVGQSAALVTVSWKSQRWTGCVESSGSNECSSAQTP